MRAYSGSHAYCNAFTDSKSIPNSDSHCGSRWHERCNHSSSCYNPVRNAHAYLHDDVYADATHTNPDWRQI